jgi:hypothetical protein
MTVKRRLNGRPKLTEGKRTKKIDARFTEDEYKLVLELEKTLSISKTELVRTRLLENAVVTVINARELIGQLDSIGTELRRSGNNINQFARYVNILQNKGVLSPTVTEQFNLLFGSYLENQNRLEICLRKVIRLIGR